MRIRTKKQNLILDIGLKLSSIYRMAPESVQEYAKAIENDVLELSAMVRDSDGTNENYIKNKDTEDFAKFIYDVSNGATKITTCTQDCSMCECSEDYCISEIAEWLGNEVE